MNQRRSLLLRTAGLALALATSLPALAQQLPFRIFDTHTHFVSSDTTRYPVRQDLPPLEHEREMREYQLRTPTTSDRVFALWEANGVDSGVAVQYRSTYNLDNSYVVDTASQFPSKVRGVVILDTLNAETPAALRRLVKERGISGIRIIGGRNAAGEYPWMDSPSARETWAVADELGIAVVVMTSPVYQADATALEKLAAQASRYPNIRIVLDHLAWPAAQGAPDFGFTPAHLALRSLRNVYFKFTTLNLQVLEKNGISAPDFVRRAVDLFGAERIMWGSDFGNTKKEYADLVKPAVAATARLQPAEQKQLLSDTGRAVFVAGGSRKQAQQSPLLDRVAIEDLLSSYLYLLDHGQVERLPELFAADGVMDVENVGALKGREAIAGYYGKRSKTRVTRHVMTNLYVTLSGPDRAKTVHTVSYHAAEAGAVTKDPALLGVAEFTNDLVRSPDGKWQISYRKASPVFGWRPPAAATPASAAH